MPKHKKKKKQPDPLSLGWKKEILFNSELRKLWEKEIKDEMRSSPFSLERQRSSETESLIGVEHAEKILRLEKLGKQLMLKGINPTLVEEEIDNFRVLLSVKLMLERAREEGVKLPEYEKKVKEMLKLEEKKLKSIIDLAEGKKKTFEVEKEINRINDEIAKYSGIEQLYDEIDGIINHHEKEREIKLTPKKKKEPLKGYT